ncbi:MAG: DHA2 family efflux MFS transporter permease subunit [Pseudolabrys sp.]
MDRFFRFAFFAAFRDALLRGREPPPAPGLAHLPYYRWLVVGSVCIGAFMGQVDSSIAQLLLPRLEYEFGARLSVVSWVAVAYLVTMAGFLPIFGHLADLVGRKLLYTGGFLVFVLGSALCGFAPDLPILIGFRIIQAIGAALLSSNSVAIVVTAAGPEQRGRALGIQAAAQAVGLSVGPVIGGLLLATLGWRWVFWINEPFGLAACVICWLVIPPTADLADESGGFDWKGAFLLLPALAAFVAVISEGHVWGIMSPALLVGILVTVIFGFLFVRSERACTAPLVDFALFRSRAFSAGNAAGLMSYAMLFGLFFLMPFILIRLYHDNVFIAGLRLAIVPMTLGLLAPVSGALSDRLGTHLLTALGMLGCGAGLLLLYFTIDGSAASLPAVMFAFAIFGAGQGLFASPNNNSIMAAAPAHLTGEAGGLMNVVRSIGMSIGIAAASALLSWRLDALTGRPVNTLGAAPEVLLDGSRSVILLLFGFAAAAGLISLAGAHGHTSANLNGNQKARIGDPLSRDRPQPLRRSAAERAMDQTN